MTDREHWMVSLSDPKIIITDGSKTSRSEVVAHADRPRHTPLLASAPDLLAALEGLVKAVPETITRDTLYNYLAELDTARAAIIKTRGA